MGKCLMQVMGAEALERVAPLFANWQETLIWSALEGGMGRIWTLGDERAALCENGDFLFAAGSAAQARPLLEAWRSEHAGRFIILAAKDPAYGEMIAQIFGNNARKEKRYAFCKGGEAFDPDKLRAYMHALPQEFELRFFDENLYHLALQADWSRDFCSQFRDAQEFLARGLGVAAIRGRELVGGASSYTVYSGGLEVQVETRADCRRRGVAAACCAKLILECLKRGLYPSWDAANMDSVRLAERMGYRQAGAYEVWELY